MNGTSMLTCHITANQKGEEMANATKTNGKTATKNRITALVGQEKPAKTIGRLKIEIPAPDFGLVTVPIVGISSLLSHAFSQKAMGKIKDKQLGKATEGRKPKNPQEIFEGCMHRLANGKPGFPAIGFKLAMVRAAKGCGMQMTDARAAIQVIGDDGGELVEIKGKPTMREDMTRIPSSGAADWRIRAEFKTWKCELLVRFNQQMISAEQVFNLANLAGSGTGVGDWRVEKNGQHGMFQVEETKLRKGKKAA